MRKKWYWFNYKDIKSDLELFLKYVREVTEHGRGEIGVVSTQVLDATTKAMLVSVGARLSINNNLIKATNSIMDMLIAQYQTEYPDASIARARSNLDRIAYDPSTHKSIKNFFEKYGLVRPPVEAVKEPVIEQIAEKENKKIEERVVGEEIPKVFFRPNTTILIANPVLARDGKTYDKSSVPAKIIPIGKKVEEDTGQTYINYFAKQMLERYAQDRTYLVPLDEADCICPLGLGLMEEPVITVPKDPTVVANQMYEKDAIEEVIEFEKKATDPKTNKSKEVLDPIARHPIKEDQLVLNLFAQDRIKAYKEALKLLEYVQGKDINGLKAFLKPSILNVRNGHKQSALHLAVQLPNDENDEISMYLIERGINIHVKDVKGRTALHYAVDAKKKEVIKKLIEKGADIDAKDEKKISPYDLAMQSQDQEIIKLFNKPNNNQEKQQSVNKTLIEYTNKLMSDVSQQHSSEVVLHEASITLHN